MSGLRDRLREIVRPEVRPKPDAAAFLGTDSPAGSAFRHASDLEQVLGGTWIRDRQSFVVERRIGAKAPYGRVEVGHIGGQIRSFAGALPLLDRRVRAELPLLFFDLETTGLSGGAGTYAFLIGYAWFDEDDAFVTRQHLLVDHSVEPIMLDAAAEELEAAGALVSFNGKSFDAPVLDTRYALHRRTWRGGELPHLDILHPSRRFWADRRSSEAEGCGCSLVALEQTILGARRHADVPGFEIPARYFQFLRSGGGGPLAAVFEHNRLDLLSLAGLAGRLLELVSRGLHVNVTPDEALALGHLYERAGAHGRAVDAFQFAARPDAPRGTRIDALRRLAAAFRRIRRYDDAAGCWRLVLEIPACPRRIVREANEALAIHHEHRVRDLDGAKRFALLSLEAGENRAWHDAVRHRLARLDRKMTASARLTFPSSP